VARKRSPEVYQRTRGELLEVARKLFLEHGYEGTSMARLAEEAQVAPNTLYWYFADKDALLVEVLNATMLKMGSEYLARMNDPLEVQLMWLLSVLEDAQQLVATVHTRAAHSPALALWHQQFHTALDLQFTAQLGARGLSPADARALGRVASYVLEGMLAHPSSKEERAELVRALVSRI
jgi:TetR/AcrR family transcriptional regulator, cholesterol catabolism regulator